MAISTYGVVLKSGTAEGSLTKLVDIKDFPDLGGSPEMLETTTLSDAMQTYILGIQSMDAMEFSYNYDDATFDTVTSRLQNDTYFSLEFGESGVDGIFQWQGEGTTWVTGGGVNEVVGAMLSIAPSTPITKVTQ